MGAQNDTVAPPANHAKPFYNAIPATVPKAYAELAGADHSAGTVANDNIAAAAISWFKLFLDGDMRYHSALCPTFLGVTPSALSAFQNTCATAAF